MENGFFQTCRKTSFSIFCALGYTDVLLLFERGTSENRSRFFISTFSSPRIIVAFNSVAKTGRNVRASESMQSWAPENQKYASSASVEIREKKILDNIHCFNDG